jgi:hypothetical protein
MKKLRFVVIVAFLSFFFFLGCKKTADENKSITKPQIKGLVQKGPFLNGTSVSIYELNASFTQTGKQYAAQILDNSGSFQLKDVMLASQYVQLKADGYYFNEVTGKNSTSPITLYALTDILDKTSVNVNILSHLEKSRIEYLLETGMTFANAKKKADQEVLQIFGITKTDIRDFDMLDISANGDDNAILLAVSVILQGFRTESELSDLLANIITDIRQDGILNSASLGSLLINDARFFKLPEIRTNIEKRYADLGITTTIADFEKYVTAFVNNSAYQPTNNITYPENSTYGENVLYSEKTDFTIRPKPISIAAKLPKGTSLKIILKEIPGVPLGSTAIQSIPNAPVNWSFTTWTTLSPKQQTIIALESGKDCDLILYVLGSGGSTKVEYYENNATTPTRTKILKF